MIYLLIKFVIKMQTRQNVAKNAKCGNFITDARSKAKLMINFFGLNRNIYLIGCFKTP